MSQLSAFKQNQNPDMVYYDIVSTNFQTTTTEEPFLRFNETRTNPIINNTGEYYLSIVRFSLDTYNLPNIICEIQPNQPDPDLSIYSLTLEYDDGVGGVTPSSQTFINWVAQNKNVAVPPAPNTTANKFQQNSKYYYCYQFQYFLSLINQAFQAAIAELITLTGGAGSPITAAKQPILTWDTTTSSAVLQAQEDYYNNNLAAKVRIFFNPPLFALFNSFPSLYFGTGVNVSLGRNYQMVVVDFTGINTILLPTNALPANQTIWTQMFQEFSTIDTWSPVASIVFVSNTIPIVSNQLSAPLVFNNGQSSSGIGNNSNFAQIITDMTTNQQVFKPNVLYNPTAEYRRIDMTGNTPLSNIDINVYWRDKLGQLIPFELASGASASIKFLFERKDKTNLKH
tara:strand:+ start:3243 stop:4433 length:1191 start_codon:yes stop_codon:yes gene_type:complete